VKKGLGVAGFLPLREDPIAVADEGAVELALEGVGSLGEELFDQCDAVLKLFERDDVGWRMKREIDDLGLREG
jgi:hypothetical protein